MVGGSLKVAHSLYCATVEAIAMNKLQAEGNLARAQACKERRDQYAKNTLKASAFVAAVYSISNEHLTKGVQIISLWNLLNTIID